MNSCFLGLTFGHILYFQRGGKNNRLFNVSGAFARREVTSSLGRETAQAGRPCRGRTDGAQTGTSRLLLLLPVPVVTTVLNIPIFILGIVNTRSSLSVTDA